MGDMERSGGHGAAASDQHHPPRLRNALARPRLHGRLDDATTRRLTCVVAPAGFGKTAAVAGWARRGDGKHIVTWLNCRTDHDGVTAFAEALASSLAPHVAVDAIPAASFEHHAAALVAAVSRRPAPVVSVIDACELVPAASPALAELVRSAPPNWRFVLVGRRPPFPETARLRASADLSEIGASELRFDVEETARLLAARGVDGAVAPLVHSATGGWPAAVAEAGGYLAAAVDRSAALDELRRGRAVLGREAAAEAVRVLSPSARAVLADAALLRNADRSAWAAVAGHPAGADAYEAAVAAQLVVPAGERWHRAHPPLRWLSQVEVAADPARRARVLGRAARWAAREDLVDDAVTYAFAAGDEAFGSSLVAEYGERFTGRGRPDRLLRLVAALDEDLARRPEILAQRGWAAVLAGDLGALAEVIEALETRADGGTDLTVAGSIFHIALALLTGDAAGAVASARILTAGLDPRPEDAGEPVDAGWAWAIHAAAASLAGDFEEAADAARVVVNGGFVGQPLILAAGVGAVLELHQGAADRAARLARLAMSVADAELEADLPVCAPALFVLAHDEDPVDAGSALRRLHRLRDLTPAPYVDLLVTLAEGVQAARAGSRSSATDVAQDVASSMPGVPGLARYVAGLSEQVDAAASMATVDSRLSPAELAVLRLMDRRLTRREIAEQLGISLNTVKFHARSVFRKLGAATSIEALERGRRLGMLDPAPPPGAPPRPGGEPSS